MPAKISGFAVAYTALGTLLLYSGIKGTSLQATFKGLASGQLNSDKVQSIGTPQLNILDAHGGSTGGTGTTGATGSAIADDALKYTGNRYVWGGTPGTTAGHDNGTDCSGFVNMVVGRDLGGAIPGYAAGAYKGASHGPPTGAWLLWGGAKTISKSEIQPGDLAVWQTHMGIFTDNGQHIISALDTKDGVVVTTLAGGSPSGEVMFARRLHG